MNECCVEKAPPTTAATVTCPACETRGVSVELRTVKALLTEHALARIEPVSHRFCRTAACPVVYFDENGGTYQQIDLRVRVWQKEPPGDRPMCYCFGETEATIRAEVARAGRSAAVERVKTHIELNRCACDVRNPRGVCCLGDLTAAVQRASRERLTLRGES